jgi:hypothetical protein
MKRWLTPAGLPMLVMLALVTHVIRGTDISGLESLAAFLFFCALPASTAIFYGWSVAKGGK